MAGRGDGDFIGVPFDKSDEFWLPPNFPRRPMVGPTASLGNSPGAPGTRR